MSRGSFLPGCLAAMATLLVGMTWSARGRADDTAACIEASDKGQLSRIDKRLRDAREQFARCAQATCPDMVRSSCARWLEEAAQAIPTIAFVVRDGSGNDVRPLKVVVDGVVVTDDYDGTALPLDPGEHLLLFSAAGHAGVERTFRLTQGERDRHEQVVLQASASTSTRTPSEPPTLPPPPSSALRVVGLSVGAAGIAGLLAGAAFGTLAIVRNDAAHCDAHDVCGDAQARRDAQSAATVSTVTFVAGGALAAGGLALVWLAGRRPDGSAAARVGLAPRLAPASLGLDVEVTW